MVIVAGSQAAIVDASAGTAQSWQMAIPRLNAMAATLRVEAGRALPPLNPVEGRSIAGLYMGMKQTYMATMINVIDPVITRTRSTFIYSPETAASTARTTKSRSPAATSRDSTSMRRRNATRQLGPVHHRRGNDPHSDGRRSAGNDRGAAPVQRDADDQHRRLQTAIEPSVEPIGCRTM